MKKLFLLFLIAFSSVFAFGQTSGQRYPLKQNISSDSTELMLKGLSRIGAGIQHAIYTDTTAANLTRVKYYPFAMIATSSDNKVWKRNASATAWESLAGGSGTITTVEIIDASTWVVCYEDGSCDTVSVTGGGAGSQSWQQTLDVSSTLDKYNVIQGAGFPIKWNDHSSIRSNLSSLDSLYYYGWGGTDYMTVGVNNPAVFIKARGNSPLDLYGGVTAGEGIRLYASAYGVSPNIRIAEDAATGTRPIMKFYNSGAQNQGSIGLDVSELYIRAIYDSTSVSFKSSGPASVLVDSSRFSLSKSVNGAVAANNLTLPYDGNLFTITGSTQINAITTFAWQPGSVIYLTMTGTPTFKDNTAGGAGTARIQLAGNQDYTAASGDVLLLQYDGTDWKEVGRSLANSSPSDAYVSVRTYQDSCFIITRASGSEDTVCFSGGGGGGSGTVTDFIFTDGSGFNGTVTNSTTTPTLSLTTTLTTGSVVFIGASGALAEDNTNFFYDNAADELRLAGIADAGNFKLQVGGATYVGTTGVITSIQMDNATNDYAEMRFSQAGTSRAAFGHGGTNSVSPYNGSFYFQLLTGTSQFMWVGTANTEVARMTNGGKLSLGTAAVPTGVIDLRAGTSAVGDAPIKLTVSGAALLSAPEVGAVEVINDSIYYTIAGPTRKRLAFAKEIGIFQLDKGANIAAANDFAPGGDGNLYTVTGNTTINAIHTTGIQAGTVISMIFTGTPLVKNNTAGGAGTATILLAGRTDFQAAAGDYLSLQYDGTNWYETNRSLAAAGGAGYTFNSGLTESPAGTVRLGGTLLANATIATTASFSLTVSGDVPVSTANGTLIVTNNHNQGQAIYATTTGSSGIAIYASSQFSSSISSTTVDGTGVVAQATGTGIALQALSQAGTVAARLQTLASSTNTVIPVLEIKRTTSGTPATGIGSSIDFITQTTTSEAISSQIMSKWTTATHASRVSEMQFWGVDAATLAQKMVITGAGIVGIGKYSSLTASRLEVVDDAIGSGSIIKMTSASTAAASNTQKILEVALSGANATSDQTTFAIHGTNTHTGSGSTINVGVYGTVTNGSSASAGVWGFAAAAQYGVKGSTVSGAGVYAEATTTGVGIQAVSTSGIAGGFDVNPSSTNTIVETVQLRRSSSGTPANGIGSSLTFSNETSTNALSISAQIASTWTDVTNATRTGDLQFFTTNSGSSTLKLSITGAGAVVHTGRHEMVQGADVASAAGAIAVGADGNNFELTGTAAVTRISNLNWQNGSVIRLLFTSTASLTDGTVNSGTDIGMELAGNVNFTGSADDVITLILGEIGGVQRWREVSRSVN